MTGQCAAAASGPEAGGDPGVKATLLALVQGQRLVCRIFFSLNWQELPEVFEDHLTTWMGEFHKYLTYDFPALVETDTEKVRRSTEPASASSSFSIGRDSMLPFLGALCPTLLLCCCSLVITWVFPVSGSPKVFCAQEVCPETHCIRREAIEAMRSLAED